MPKTNLGRVSVVPKGEYNPTVQYERLDVISYKDSSYMVLKSVKGIEPIDDNINYMLIAGYTHSEEFTNLSEQVKNNALKAQTSEINASTSETSAKQSAQQSKQSETNAKNSQDDVILKASQVSEDLIKTNNNVTTTETAKNEAVKQAEISTNSANASKQSELNSKASENASKISETNSKTSADNAKQSELKAKTSEVLSANNAKFADVIAIKQNAKGNPIQISDSANYGFLYYEINGTTTQDGIPTPENPVEIVNENIKKIISNGKNLFSCYDIKGNKNGTVGEITELSDNSFKINFNNSGVLQGYYFRLNQGEEKYVVSGKVKSNTNVDLKIGAGRNQSVSISASSVPQNFEKSFVDNNVIFYSGQENATAEVEFYDIQIELGDTATSYKPYHGKTITLSQPVELSKWDRIIKKDGVWGKENNTENILSYNSEPISTEYISSTGSLTTGANVIYKKSEPIFESLPEIDQQALNSLETYYPETVVTTQGEQSLTYLADTKTYIDNKIKELNQAVISTGGNI